MSDTISAATARRMALAAQGFGRPRPARIGPAALRGVIDRLGVLQIDSVNVFSRSHYMPAFSRLGAYDTVALDRLTLRAGGPYVEYWAHVAAFMPIEDWGLWAFRMDEYDQRWIHGDADWFSAHAATIDRVRAELAERGPLRPVDLEEDARGPRGPWWDWSLVKEALERMFLAGHVAIAGRQGFERRYALAEHVIPDDIRAIRIERDDAIRELMSRALRSYGVATAADLADYYRLRDRSAVLTALRQLEDLGVAIPVAVEGWERGGRALPAWMHVDARRPRRIDHAALLTPFDPVVWFRDRAERLFGFEYRIEIYTPAARRQYGYYSLPLLVGDRIVGRADLKAARNTRTLLVQSAWWEHHARPDDAVHVAEELRRAAAWQGMESISVGLTGTAADDLADALGGRTSVPRHRRD